MTSPNPAELGIICQYRGTCMPERRRRVPESLALEGFPLRILPSIFDISFSGIHVMPRRETGRADELIPASMHGVTTDIQYLMSS